MFDRSREGKAVAQGLKPSNVEGVDDDGSVTMTTPVRHVNHAPHASRICLADAARLTVNQQIVSVEYQLIEDDLKTASSRRSDDGFVFAKPDGSPIHPDLISQTFQRFMNQIDLPKILLHDLRHTHATILLQQNVHPKMGK